MECRKAGSSQNCTCTWNPVSCEKRCTPLTHSSRKQGHALVLPCCSQPLIALRVHQVKALHKAGFLATYSRRRPLDLPVADIHWSLCLTASLTFHCRLRLQLGSLPECGGISRQPCFLKSPLCHQQCYSLLRASEALEVRK